MRLEDQFEKLAPEWKPDEAMQSLIDDEQRHPEELPWDRGKAELETYFPLAVRSVGQLALHARDERTRLNASKYLIAANVQLRRMAREEADAPLGKMFERFEREINAGR